MFAPDFKILGEAIAEKSLTQISLCITLEWEMEKWKKEGKINFIIVVFFNTIYFNHLCVYTKFEDSSSFKSQETCDKNFSGRKRKMDK